MAVSRELVLRQAGQPERRKRCNMTKIDISQDFWEQERQH